MPAVEAPYLIPELPNRLIKCKWQLSGRRDYHVIDCTISNAMELVDETCQLALRVGIEVLERGLSVRRLLVRSPAELTLVVSLDVTIVVLCNAHGQPGFEGGLVRSQM